MPVIQTEKPAIAFATPYQAVLLSNNSVYFGKLSGYETSNPVLTDVYYILSKQDPTRKQAQNVLVKRGKELRRPDRMYLHANSIIFCGTGRHRPQDRAAHSGSQSAEVASTTTLARPGMRRRAGSSSPLAEIPCVATIGMTFHVVH
jgi:small nuclear ribonucleoprotein (snRNP)-like protein